MQLENTKKPPPATPKSGRRKALGKGLDALIPVVETKSPAAGGFLECEIGLIRPNRYQPRVRFDDSEMQELAESVRAQGIIQPLLVTRDENGYELIAGERRLRAARMAGLTTVPVVIREVTDAELLAISLIENIQRNDLNPMEEADAYHRLITEFDLTQEEAARRVGKSRSAVANTLRLRQLPRPIKDSLVDGLLSMGHARALLGLETAARQLAAWRTVMAKELSVRETERLVNQLRKQTAEPSPPRPRAPLASYLTEIADDLSRHFGTRVVIRRQGKQGRLQIDFYSDEDLDRLVSLIKG